MMHANLRKDKNAPECPKKAYNGPICPLMTKFALILTVLSNSVNMYQVWYSMSHYDNYRQS
jgi:hypothetical protein